MIHENILYGTTKETFEAVANNSDPYPKVVEIHPTDICNQRCDYCFHGGLGFGEDRDVSKYLKPEQYKSLFKEFNSLGIRNVSISGGGEPFLSRNIATIIKDALDQNLTVRIVTNGNFIPDDMLPDLVRCSEIRVSMDTVDPETYGALRNVDQKLMSDTITNIKKLVTARKKFNSDLQIGATFIVNPSNTDHITNFADTLLREIGIDKVIFKHDVYGRYLKDDVNKKVIEQLTSVKEKWGNKTEVRNVLEPFVSGLPCIIPYFKPVINPYGDMFSCCLGSQPGEINGYNLTGLAKHLSLTPESAFESAWKESKPVRDQLLKGVKCVDCNYTDRKINEMNQE